MLSSTINFLWKKCSKNIVSTTGLNTDEVHSLRILQFKHNNLYWYLKVL